MLGRTICKKKVEEYKRLSGCAKHTKHNLGPVRWVEFMRRGEFFEQLLTPFFNLTFY